MVRIGRKTNIRLIVGGIAGYSAGMIKNVTMEKGSKVESAGINHYFLQSCKESYTGGAIGFKDSAAEINSDSNFSINCTVKGTKNVGGLIGYNRNGKITNYVNNAVVKGEENVGGIIGWICNGNIKNCENNANVTRNSGVTSRNIGGIVGYSETSNIEKCKNKGAIKGSQNVGGITGQQKHGGTISLCENIGNVEGKGNNYSYKTTLEYFANDCKLTKCYNSGTVTGNKNIGGVVGLTGLSEITYSYNKGDIESTLSFIGSLKGTTGGICGLGATVNVLGCYNIGTVRGFKDFAGIMGVTYGKENKICYCYNAGTFEKTSYYEPTGILADADLSTGETTVHECYYRKSTIKKPNRYGNAMNDNELKQQLYNWANSLSEPDAGEFMYNTVAPVENSKGYEGYGVLWWEIEDYVKLNINMFMCVIDEEENTKTYTGIPLFSTNTYKPKVILNDKEVNFDSLPAELVMIEKKLPNDEPVECNSYLNWKFMVKNEKYTVKGSVAFTDESEYFDGNTAKGRNKFIELEKWEQDKTISVAPIMETRFDNLDSKDIEVIWKRGETESNLFTTLPWNVYDKEHDKIEKVKGYFYYKTHNSDVIEKDQKSVKIKMDKGDEAEITKNQTVYIKKTEYYKREGSFIKGYTYRGPYYIEEGTEASKVKGKINVKPEYEKAHANKSACNVYNRRRPSKKQ